MMSGGDWTMPYLLRATLLICVFFVFGAILNRVVLTKEKLLQEKDHRTSVRISLLKADCDRQLGDLREKSKLTCEQTVREAVQSIEGSVKEAKGKIGEEVHSYYSRILRNQSNEIDSLKEELKRILNLGGRELNVPATEKIWSRLDNLKLKLSSYTIEENNIPHDNLPANAGNDGKGR